MKDKEQQMRAEYSEDRVRSGVRGKHAKRIQKGSRLVILDPELQEFFPDSDAVNGALREYLTRRS